MLRKQYFSLFLLLFTFRFLVLKGLGGAGDLRRVAGAANLVKSLLGAGLAPTLFT